MSTLPPALGIWPLVPLIVLLLGCGDINIDLGSGEDGPVEVREDSFLVGPSPRLDVGTFNGQSRSPPARGAMSWSRPLSGRPIGSTTK